MEEVGGAEEVEVAIKFQILFESTFRTKVWPFTISQNVVIEGKLKNFKFIRNWVQG